MGIIISLVVFCQFLGGSDGEFLGQKILSNTRNFLPIPIFQSLKLLIISYPKIAMETTDFTDPSQKKTLNPHHCSPQTCGFSPQIFHRNIHFVILH
jgi:hypothetical protein